MNGTAHRRLTFAMLDLKKGIPAPPSTTCEEYPLPAWYRAVRETPLEELGVEDICKACRQQIHLEHVVHIALRLLQSEPLAGEMYDGELLASLNSVPCDYWSSRAAEAAMLRTICVGVREHTSMSDDLRQDVVDLLKKVELNTSGLDC